MKYPGCDPRGRYNDDLLIRLGDAMEESIPSWVPPVVILTVIALGIYAFIKL